jgi:hypothetical protein
VAIDVVLGVALVISPTCEQAEETRELERHERHGHTERDDERHVRPREQRGEERHEIGAPL